MRPAGISVAEMGKKNIFCEGAGGFVVVDFKKAFRKKKSKFCFCSTFFVFKKNDAFFFMYRSSFSMRSGWRHLEVSNLQPQSLQRPHKKMFFLGEERFLPVELPSLRSWLTLRGKVVTETSTETSASARVLCSCGFRVHLHPARGLPGTQNTGSQWEARQCLSNARG